MKHRHPSPFGAELLSDGATRFRLWAPGAKRVELVIDGAREERVAMSSAASGWYELSLPNVTAGTRYRYRIDDEINVPDPASRFNPEGVHGASEIIDPLAFDWQDDAWRGRPWREAVVYELHVGAFTPEGTFTAIIPRLPQLAQLGITAIELMPIATFAGQRGWGYDGVLPYAPQPSYGRPEDLKRLAQAAHAHGIMMLLDVVYNHFGPEGNYLHRYAEAFFTSRHHTPWGKAINFEGENGRKVRDFFIHNALYWIEEYRFDGLRIDAVHAMLDDSPVHFIDELTATAQDGPGRERPIHVVLENHANGARHLRDGRNGCVSQWNDDAHHPLHVLLSGETDGYYRDFAAQPLQQLGRALAEGFAFQGERSEFDDNHARGEPSAHLPPTVFVNFLQTHDQIGNRAFGERLATLSEPAALRAALAILLLAPQPPMLFMGEEYAATQPFLYFCDYTGELAAAVREGRQREFSGFARFTDEQAIGRIADPNDERTFASSRLEWREREQSPHRDWWEYTRSLLQLRREHVVPLIPRILAGKARYGVDGSVLSVDWPTEHALCLRLVANMSNAVVAYVESESARRFFSTSSERNATRLGAWEIRWMETKA